MLRIVIFDVGNGSCSLIVDQDGNSLMIDCGCHSETMNPVDWIKQYQENGWLQHMESNQLTKLIISHPDLDHIKNAKRIHKELEPRILLRRKLEYFPQELLATEDENFKEYKSNFCDNYTTAVSDRPNWKFRFQCYQIPLEKLYDEDVFARDKFKNNSSIVCTIKFGGKKILFGGDMEEVGWQWLIKHDGIFKEDITGGVAILVASHHGHKSGYSQELMNLMGGGPILSVLSKGSESGDSDVDSRYSGQSIGWPIKKPKLQYPEIRKSVTTRNDGNILFEVSWQGNLRVYTER